MGLNKDIRRRRRVYTIDRDALSLVDGGMSLWDFSRAIMQLPEDARIVGLTESLWINGVNMLVVSMEFDEAPEGAEAVCKRWSIVDKVWV